MSFKHPVRLIANALGTAPDPMIGQVNDIIPVATSKAKEHAMKQIEAGVDSIVTGWRRRALWRCFHLVLIPEVLQAIEEADTQILSWQPEV